MMAERHKGRLLGAGRGRGPQRRRKRRYLVVTNDEVTEPEYLRGLESELDDVVVEIRPVRRDPAGLAKYAKDLASKERMANSGRGVDGFRRRSSSRMSMNSRSGAFRTQTAYAKIPASSSSYPIPVSRCGSSITRWSVPKDLRRQESSSTRRSRWVSSVGQATRTSITKSSGGGIKAPARTLACIMRESGSRGASAWIR